MVQLTCSRIHTQIEIYTFWWAYLVTFNVEIHCCIYSLLVCTWELVQHWQFSVDNCKDFLKSGLKSSLWGFCRKSAPLGRWQLNFHQHHSWRSEHLGSLHTLQTAGTQMTLVEKKLKFVKCFFSGNKVCCSQPLRCGFSGPVLKSNPVFSVHQMCEARASVEAWPTWGQVLS